MPILSLISSILVASYILEFYCVLQELPLECWWNTIQDFPSDFITEPAAPEIVLRIRQWLIMDRKQVLSLLRNLYRELKPTLPMGQKYVLRTGHWKHITALVEKNQKPEDTAENRRILRAGHNYLEYFRSIRKYNEIMEKYKGKGERNATDLAHVLGFKMPNEPKEPRKPPKVDSSSSTS